MKIITYNVNGLRAAASKGLPKLAGARKSRCALPSGNQAATDQYPALNLKRWVTKRIFFRQKRKDTVEWPF
jgi:exonuclease III